MLRMTLDEYMRARRVTDAALAKTISKDRTLVSRYRRGLVMPPATVIAAIEVATKGAVKLRDWIAAPRERRSA